MEIEIFHQQHTESEPEQKNASCQWSKSAEIHKPAHARRQQVTLSSTERSQKRNIEINVRKSEQASNGNVSEATSVDVPVTKKSVKIQSIKTKKSSSVSVPTNTSKTACKTPVIAGSSTFTDEKSALKTPAGKKQSKIPVVVTSKPVTKSLTPSKEVNSRTHISQSVPKTQEHLATPAKFSPVFKIPVNGPVLRTKKRSVNSATPAKSSPVFKIPVSGPVLRNKKRSVNSATPAKSSPVFKIPSIGSVLRNKKRSVNSATPGKSSPVFQIPVSGPVLRTKKRSVSALKLANSDNIKCSVSATPTKSSPVFKIPINAPFLRTKKTFFNTPTSTSSDAMNWSGSSLNSPSLTRTSSLRKQVCFSTISSLYPDGHEEEENISKSISFPSEVSIYLFSLNNAPVCVKNRGGGVLQVYLLVVRIPTHPIDVTVRNPSE